MQGSKTMVDKGIVCNTFKILQETVLRWKYLYEHGSQ